MASQLDYLLATDLQTFSNVVVKDPHHNNYRCMVLGCLQIRPLKLIRFSW